MNCKPSKREIEEMAKEVRSFLIEHSLWIDTTIYFNGKAFTTSKNGHYAYNDPNDLLEISNVDPARMFDYTNPDHILSMSFEGPLYDVLNFDGEYSSAFCNEIEGGLRDIFAKRGCYYELGNSWNLSLFLQ